MENEEKAPEAPAAPAAPAEVKPGPKTTEFWFTLLGNLIGALMSSGLLADGSKEMKICGVVMMMLTTLGYTVSRGWVKKSAMVFLVVITLPFMTGCTKGTIRVGAIDGSVSDVCDRHDKLLRGELKVESISAADKETYLRSSAILKAVVEEAKK